ncbi:MAG: efflux transporter outer membrane subunit [Magnetococcus sp. DMHC-8]
MKRVDVMRVRGDLPPGVVRGQSAWRGPWQHPAWGMVCGLWVCLLTGCTLLPDYRPPAMAMPAEFKESGWQPAQPGDHLPRGAWWEWFGDAVLNRLEERLVLDNQSLKEAEARYRVALAQVETARAAFFPVLTGNLGISRGEAVNAKSVLTTRSLGSTASWEWDVWGRIRHAVEAGEAGAQASLTDLEGARLSLQAQLAQNYFLLRVAEEQQQLYRETLAAYEKSLTLTRNQLAAGVATPGDVAQAESQLKSAQAQALDTELQHAQLEHVLAQLVGQVPADFVLESAVLTGRIPVIPPGLPSELLERRPDVAAAERRVAAANAQIGVATAAFFPALTLGAAGGYQGTSQASWFTAPSRYWSLGPSLAAALFDNGLRQAQQAQALATYDQAVAHYRQTVLNALQEVEDNLAALRLLEAEAEAQEGAVQAARQAQALAENQYRAGVVSYLVVGTTQAARLASERAALSLRGRRYTAAVTLVKALGGGWGGVATQGEQEK